MCNLSIVNALAPHNYHYHRIVTVGDKSQSSPRFTRGHLQRGATGALHLSVYRLIMLMATLYSPLEAQKCLSNFRVICQGDHHHQTMFALPLTDLP